MSNLPRTFGRQVARRALANEQQIETLRNAALLLLDAYEASQAMCEQLLRQQLGLPGRDQT
jgi:hypothetical protein